MRGSTEDIVLFQDEEVHRMAKVEEVNEFLKYYDQEIIVESVKKIFRRITWIEGKHIQY